MADDPDAHAPRVMAEHPRANMLTRHERQALGFETFHDLAIVLNEAARVQEAPGGFLANA
jgi:hypothetical protein